MRHIKQSAPTRLIQRGKGITVGMALFLAGSLGLASLTLGQDSAPLSAAQLTVRGPNEAVVGQRFTLEILITNAGGAILKDVQLLAALDANLEQKGAGGENHVKVEAITPGKIHIVRLFLTPTKKGPAGVDITLSAKNGEMRQIRHVLPVFAADDAPPQVERPNGASPLKVTVTTPKECLADQTGTFLLYVVNTDSRATPDKLDLVVSYVTNGTPQLGPLMRNDGPRPQPLLPPRQPKDLNELPHAPIVPGPRKGGAASAKIALPFVPNPGNPTRQVHVSLPSLAPQEGRTIPVEITPRRVGQLNVSIASNNQVVGSAIVQVKFDAKIPLHQFLPEIKTTGAAPHLPKSLTEVPEVSLEDPLARTINPNEAFEHVAHLFDKINYINTRKMDAFVDALMGQRADLAGLPVSMGHACRLPADRALHFATELSSLRVALSNPAAGLAGRLPNPLDANHGGVPARVAAMFQVLGPETSALRQEMVKYLGSVSHVDATKVLAKLAIFSEEEQVRQTAIDALKTRREKDYGDILVQGLNYPWPAVAERSSEAIVKLKRNDLLPQVADVLDQADPRSPVVKDVDGKKVPVVREVVRINHLRNCILCHSPRTPDQNPMPVLRGQAHAVLVANVPIPNQPLPPPNLSMGGYGQMSIPETMIRFDVTYLRQDFSMMLAVADAQPWPATQRFDFLVRSRTVSEKDAQAYRDLLRPTGLSSYQQAALAALRQLTGRDAEPNTAAWRRLLDKVGG